MKQDKDDIIIVIIVIIVIVDKQHYGIRYFVVQIIILENNWYIIFVEKLEIIEY